MLMMLDMLDLLGRDVNTVFNVCCSAAWLVGVTCILHLTYKFIREYTYVAVNCWFCNENSRVPFKQKNEWVCPRCEQFNGFTKDGDYSKHLPEQYHERLSDKNVFMTLSPKDKLSNLNGLCRTCNANQELKIRQIASYVPLREKEYDQEIKLFKEKLERSYKLCPICERTVQSTLKWKSRMYSARNLLKNENYLKEESSTGQGHSGKWKYFIGLLLATITLASLLNYFKFHNYMAEFETRVHWPEMLTSDHLTIPEVGENYRDFLSSVVLVCAALFTKNYFGKSTLLSLLLFGLLTSVISNSVSAILKIAGVISTCIYLIFYKLVKQKGFLDPARKISKECYESDLEDEDNETATELKAFSHGFPNSDIPICGKLSSLNLGRTQSASSIPKSSYLFKSSKLLVQPPKLILDDPDESTDTIRSFHTASSGYQSMANFVRKSPDSVSEFDSISQVGYKSVSNSRRSSPNTLIPYYRHRPAYTSTPEQFYGVSAITKTNQSTPVLNTSNVQVSTFFSALQIFLCSLAFFILGFSFQVLLSNLKF